jgi:hypothetical protein
MSSIINLDGLNLELKYEEKTEFYRFSIKNKINDRFMISDYSYDNKLRPGNNIPSIFDQNIVLLSSISVNNLGDDINYAFCDMDFAKIINDIYIQRTGDNYISGISLKTDKKGEIVGLNITDGQKVNIILNSLYHLHQFYMRRTPKFTFDDFKKAVQKYKETYTRTFLYDIIISSDITEEFFNKMIERLRIRAILELSIWRTKLEDYKKKVRDVKGDIISKNPIKYFEQILNPFNLEELVNIGVNYSDRYKELLKDKYTVLTYTGSDFKQGIYYYTPEEIKYITKLQEFLNLDKRIKNNLLSLEREYSSQKKFIKDMKEKIGEYKKELDKLRDESYDELETFKNDWRSYIELTGEYTINKEKFLKLIYNNVFVDIIKSKLEILKKIKKNEEFLDESYKLLLNEMIIKYENLLNDYILLTKYYNQLSKNNETIIVNLNKLLIEYIDNLLKTLNITITLNNNSTTSIPLSDILNIDINNILEITIPNTTMSISDVPISINPFTFEVKSDFECDDDSFGNLGNILKKKPTCSLDTKYELTSFERIFKKGDLILRHERLGTTSQFILNKDDNIVRIKFENLFKHIIKLKYSDYLFNKYDDVFDTGKKAELDQELQIINTILYNSKISQINLKTEIDESKETDKKLRRTVVERETSIDNNKLASSLVNTLKSLKPHQRHLEIAFFFELYLKSYQYSQKYYILEWIDYIIKLNDIDEDTKILLSSELNNLSFNVKLKIGRNEFIYNNDKTFMQFVKELNDIINIDYLLLSRDLKNELKKKLEEMKISEYENYKELKSLIEKIVEDGKPNEDIIDEINGFLSYLEGIDIDELKYIKELIIELKKKLIPYGFNKKINNLSKKIDSVIIIINENIDDSEKLTITDRRDTFDTRRRTEYKSDSEKTSIPKYNITVFTITKGNKYRFDLLNNNVNVQRIIVQKGGEIKYQTRDFYLLRDKIFYDSELKKLYDSIPDKIKNYEIISLPKINIKKNLEVAYNKTKDYYGRILNIFNKNKDHYKKELKKIKDAIKINIKSLNSYEIEFKTENIENIKILERQKISFPFEIYYYHYSLDLINLNNTLLDKLTKAVINFVKSKGKQAIYRNKSIEYKIINNLSYNYDPIKKHLSSSRDIKLSDILLSDLIKKPLPKKPLPKKQQPEKTQPIKQNPFINISQNIIKTFNGQDPNILWRIIRNTYFGSSTDQQDAGEFMTQFLNSMIEYQPEIKSTFSFNITTQTKCYNNSNSRDKIEEDIILKLQFPKDISESQILTLNELIENYKQEEIVESKLLERDCPEDETQHRQKRNLSNFSDYLIINLGRNIFNEDGSQTKIKNNININPEITLDGNIYNLIGYSKHQGGTIKSGHYVSIVKYQDKWYQISDNNIEELDRLNNQDEPFILLYQRNDIITNNDMKEIKGLMNKSGVNCYFNSSIQLLARTNMWEIIQDTETLLTITPHTIADKIKEAGEEWEKLRTTQRELERELEIAQEALRSVLDTGAGAGSKKVELEENVEKVKRELTTLLSQISPISPTPISPIAIEKKGIKKYKITTDKDILSLLPEYTRLERSKVSALISDEEYQTKNIMGQYISGKFYYYVVNNIPKYKQKKNQKKVEPLNILSLDDEINFNKLLIIISLLNDSFEIIIPFVDKIKKKRLKNIEGIYYLISKVKITTPLEEKKLFLSNLILLLIENYMSLKIEIKYPEYFENSDELKQKYQPLIENYDMKEKILDKINIILTEFVFDINDYIYNILPSQLKDKYFIQISERNKIFKYNFELFLDYVINVIKLQMLRDNSVSITREILLQGFTEILTQTIVINKEVLVNRLLELNKKKKTLSIPDYEKIFNEIMGDSRIKNIKEPRKGRLIRKLNAIKIEYRSKINQEQLQEIEKQNKLITEKINNLLENFDKITQEDIEEIDRNIERLEILINRNKIVIDKEEIIKKLLQIR